MTRSEFPFIIMLLSSFYFQQLQWAGRIMMENTNLSSAAARPCFNSITTSLMENIPPCSLSQIFSTIKVSCTKFSLSGPASALKPLFILWWYLHHYNHACFISRFSLQANNGRSWSRESLTHIESTLKAAEVCNTMMIVIMLVVVVVMIMVFKG